MLSEICFHYYSLSNKHVISCWKVQVCLCAKEKLNVPPGVSVTLLKAHGLSISDLRSGCNKNLKS